MDNFRWVVVEMDALALKLGIKSPSNNIVLPSGFHREMKIDGAQCTRPRLLFSYDTNTPLPTLILDTRPTG